MHTVDRMTLKLLVSYFFFFRKIPYTYKKIIKGGKKNPLNHSIIPPVTKNCGYLKPHYMVL